MMEYGTFSTAHSTAFYIHLRLFDMLVSNNYSCSQPLSHWKLQLAKHNDFLFLSNHTWTDDYISSTVTR